MQHHLGNEEKVILFKKELLNEFFEVYPTLFNDLENNINKYKFEVNGKFDYDMKTIRKIIDPLLKEHKVLQAVSVLKDLLKNEPEYQELSFKDYFKIVNEIYAEIYS